MNSPSSFHPFLLQLLTFVVVVSTTISCQQATDKTLLMFNNKTKSMLHLSDNEWDTIAQLNKDYWESRQAIWQDASRRAKHTAVLASWDDWRLAMQESLDEAKYRKLLAWQSKVDLLSEEPF